ncbi:MAG: DNA-binding protein [Ignavibacteriales bacterium CG12_big_fil_rev_8_21_14_0_65_30_8]|nr:MAG: DNA-binding protein [Ignavibacteriales bacterium CG12_big_fil_rev_8_21_14_0_65_30_8]
MASRPMTKGEILSHLSKKTNTTKKIAGEFLNELTTLAYKEAKNSFVLPGLGKLQVANRKKRIGRNPATGATMVIPAKKVLKFKVSKTAADVVFPSQKKAAPKKKAKSRKR